MTDPNATHESDYPETDFNFGADNPLDSDLIKRAIEAIGKLSKTRIDDYDQWIHVGMALYSLNKTGLQIWEQWSKQSPMYIFGTCSEKWRTFTAARIIAEDITFDHLEQWAKDDAPIAVVLPCPKNPKPSDYKRALQWLGYRFALNEMNDEIFVNGARMTDPLEARIINALYEHGYKLEQLAKRCILETALDNQFHPIRDYFNSLTYEGGNDIEKLTSHFTDKDGVFPILLRKWLIGAAGRILAPNTDIQNPVLVLDGRQGIGKSHFAWWLGTPLPAYYVQGAITTGDKDSLIRLCSTFIWELSEIGATLSRNDIESLKAFITIPSVRVRAPYGHHDMHKTPTASFIGTFNNVRGFLADPTGNRRFHTCTIENIDWNYANDIDVNQVWAEAVMRFLGGETSILDETTQGKVNEINANYEIEDAIAYPLFKIFKVDPKKKMNITSTGEIIEELRNNNLAGNSSNNALSQEIAKVLYRS